MQNHVSALAWLGSALESFETSRWVNLGGCVRAFGNPGRPRELVLRSGLTFVDETCSQIVKVHIDNAVNLALFQSRSIEPCEVWLGKYKSKRQRARQPPPRRE